jgi:hypothetical protein
MLTTAIDNSLVIAGSMMLMPSGHPDALLEVQRQMRLINQAYSNPEVLRLTDDVVRCAGVLHGPPGADSEVQRRQSARSALERLRNLLALLPDPPASTLSRKKPARTPSGGTPGGR